jgi:hypothetical protein
MAIFRHVMGGPGAAGDVWTSRLHTIGTGTIDAAQAAWEAFIAQFPLVAGVSGFWPGEVQIDQASTYQLDPLTGKSTALRLGSASVAGTSTGDASPPRDCLVVGLRTAKPGPGGRGRMYLPLVARTSLEANGLILSSVQTSLAAFFANILNDMASSGFTPVVWRQGSTTGDIITSVTISAVPGSQRRRSNKIAPRYESAVLA